MAVRDNPNFALRIPREKLDKIKYIAEYNARSANKEIEVIITDQIKKFEKKYGEIIINSKNQSN